LAPFFLLHFLKSGGPMCESSSVGFAPGVVPPLELVVDNDGVLAVGVAFKLVAAEAAGGLAESVAHAFS
jgi:hypothetical protein